MLTFFFIACLIFGLAMTYFIYLNAKRKHEFDLHEKENIKKLLELSLLTEINQKIGPSLNIESIAGTIAMAMTKVLDLSSVSYAVRGPQNSIAVKTFRKDNVGPNYIKTVINMVVSGMAKVDASFSSKQIVELPGVNVIDLNLKQYYDTVPQSAFNVPIVIDNKLLGLINVSSLKKENYKDQDMNILFRLVNIAQNTIVKFNTLFVTEKGKLDSMILSLPSGAILFNIEKGNFSLSLINQAAKNFLRLIDSDTIGVPEILASFSQDLKISEHIKEVITEKKSMILRSSKVFDKTFTIYITPVFNYNTQDIVGVSMTMRDMTFEEKVEKVRTDFTNKIVHELRAPTAAIRGASAMLQSKSLSKEDEAKMMKVISDSANNMLNTISDILDVGKMEEGKLKIKKTHGDIVKIVEQHVNVFSYAAREKDIDVKFEKPENISEFLFDPEQIGQVINNLVSNSLKFTENGGHIIVEIKHGSEHSSAGKNISEIEVVVKDSGVGVPAREKALLFTKFGRIQHKQMGEGQSSGLGLYISKQIVEAHGGKIWVESPIKTENGEETHGTAVHFTLPLKDGVEAVSAVTQFAN